MDKARWDQYYIHVMAPLLYAGQSDVLFLIHTLALHLYVVIMQLQPYAFFNNYIIINTVPSDRTLNEDSVHFYDDQKSSDTRSKIC